jgi:hypothetical protein
MFFSHSLDFVFSVGHINQVSPGNTVQRVTGRADFLVHLETTTDGSMVIGIQRAIVGPGVFRRVKTFVSHVSRDSIVHIHIGQSSGTNNTSSNSGNLFGVLHQIIIIIKTNAMVSQSSSHVNNREEVIRSVVFVLCLLGDSIIHTSVTAGLVEAKRAYEKKRRVSI